MQHLEYSLEEEDSKGEMAKPVTPTFSVIQQTDKNGKQLPVLPKRASWFASLCNCFRSFDSSYTNVSESAFLPEQSSKDLGRNTLVLDLDETLVHSTFSKVASDITLEIEIENQRHKIYVLKRPGVDDFLSKCCSLFEVVIFTASLSIYANPLLDQLDPSKQVSYRLFRDSCTYTGKYHTKDLSKLGRNLKHTIIVDVRTM